MIANHGGMFVLTVVIARNSSGSDVSVFSDGGVAKIGKVHRFCAATDLRLLDFNKVSDDGAFFHASVHTQMSEGSDRAIVGNLGINDHAMIFDCHPFAEK